MFCEVVIRASAALALLLALGCGQQPPSPPVANPAADDRPGGGGAAVNSASVTNGEPRALAAPVVAPVSTAAEPADPGQAASAGKVAAPATPPGDGAENSERLLLLTARGPLLIELQLTIAGQPHQQALARLVEQAFAAADTDGDGRPMWSELLASPKFRYGQFGNLPLDSDSAKNQVRQRYDLDQDQVVDREELPRLLTRNAGLARAFSLRSVSERRTAGRESSLWAVFDGDLDGALSAEERAAVPARLRQRDADDDELLLADELAEPSALELENRGETRLRRSDVARLLGPHAAWDAVQLALEQRYAPSGVSNAQQLGWSADAFLKLDADRNGRLTRKEHAGWNDLPAQLILAADFPGEPLGEQPAGTDATGSQPPVTATLRLVRIDPALTAVGVACQARDRRVILTARGTTLVIYLSDTLAAADFAAQAQQLFASLDADKNGYLEAAELPPAAAPQAPPFAAADIDENGKVYPAEIAAFLRQQQAGERAQIHARAEERGDALFSLFDADHDERLSPREVAAAPALLSGLAGDPAGQLFPVDLPESLALGLARGNIENQDALFRPPVVVRAPDPSAPPWFSAMDHNGDGALSPREFLGAPGQFRALDKNIDGLVDLSEAQPATQGDAESK